MSRYVKVATLCPPALRDPPSNSEQAVTKMIEHWHAQFDLVLPDQPDLIVVPECCDQYDGMKVPQVLDYYRYRGNRVRDAFAIVAREHRCYITYSAVSPYPDGSFRNSVHLLDRRGEVAGYYHKNHPTMQETTEQGILCGRDAAVIQTDFGKVGFAICFDLNFEPLRLKYRPLKPDLLVFSSVYHGGLMQAYWAYFLRCHVLTAVANLPGAVISPVGHIIAGTTNYFRHVVATINLDCAVAHLDYNWPKLTAMKQRYGSEVDIFDPGHLGSVLISSQSHQRSAKDLVAEFGIEYLDDYLDRALRFHAQEVNREPEPEI